VLRFSRLPGSDSVVPFRMEGMPRYVERLHLGLADFDAFLIMACIKRALNFEGRFWLSLPRWTRPQQYDLSAVWRAKSG